MKYYSFKVFILLAFVFLLTGWVATNIKEFYIPTTINDFFLPGSQPLESGTFISANQCDNCHGNFDVNTEPAFNWRGSMMSQSMRDPLFEASMVIANQDAQFSGDLCIRCHSPGGWLEGRSTPTDGSVLTVIDREGVQCHVCHKMMDPFSNNATDLNYINTLNNKPTVHGNGMYVMDNQDIRRGPYNDITQVPHAINYSEFHTKSEMCATCHDVSNPAYSKQSDGTYLPNTLGTEAPSFNTYDMFPVERTYSEWKMSAYNSPAGIPSTAFGGNLTNVISCQDCHMKEVTGKGANKSFVPIRNNLGQHDLTGGNTFIPLLIKNLYANDSDVDLNAIDAGILRAEYMLKNAATLNLNATAIGDGFDVEVEVINETGHKLPSGYPEGRRIWINLRAYDESNNLIYESGAYDNQTAILETVGTKIYEAKLGISDEVAAIANASGTGGYSAGESFHFALNNVVIKDNRIPPRGFTNSNFQSIQAAPVGYSYADGSFSDITHYTVPANTYKVEAKLYYQTVSKEYIDFLRDNNTTNTKGQDLYNLWVALGKSQPVEMKEAEFYTSSLSINKETSLFNNIKIYPNPSADFLTIHLENNFAQLVKIDLFTISGSKIASIYNGFLNPIKQNLYFDISKLANGNYLIKFSVNGNSFSKLIVINR